MTIGNIINATSLTASARPLQGVINYIFYDALPGYYFNLNTNYVSSQSTAFTYTNPVTGKSISDVFTLAERNAANSTIFGTSTDSSVNGVLSIAQVVTSKFQEVSAASQAQLGYGALNTSIYQRDPITGVNTLTFAGANEGDSDHPSLGQSDVSGYNFARYTLGGISFPWQGQTQEGDTWVLSRARLQVDAEQFQMTVLHETAHGLGLAHTFEVGLSGAENSSKFSIMSRTAHPGEGRPATELQLYDIASLQRLYGRDDTTASGDNVYKVFDELVPPNAPVSLQQDRIFSIWDGGGKDTIDASSYTGVSSFIDLRPGHFSSIGTYTFDDNAPYVTGEINDNLTVLLGSNGSLGRENISIAFGAFIENAIGGDHNDVIIGNMFANVIDGGEGNDLLFADGFGIALADARLKAMAQLDPAEGSSTGTGLTDDLFSATRDADYRLIRKGGTSGITLPAAATVNDIAGSTMSPTAGWAMTRFIHCGATCSVFRNLFVMPTLCGTLMRLTG